MRVTVCGAGAIGASVAYFLAEAGADVTIVERTGVACAASGKSGGFLALDWCDGLPVEALARRSFALHEELAGRLPADWGYRRVTTYAGVEVAGAGSGPVTWTGPVAITQKLGGPETTAQVHPERYTRALVDAAVARGARIVSGVVEGIESDDAVSGVVVDGNVLATDAVVLALGPWTHLPGVALPLVEGVMGHSLVYATGGRLPAEALFLETRDGATPEIFPRPDGTTYVCALSCRPPLPDDPADVAPEPDAPETLERIVARIAPALAQHPIVARQACFRPTTRDGVPLIGAVPGLAGAYVATGHSVWGILNAPATGEAMAELIVTGGTTHVDLAPFDPNRFAGRRRVR